MIFNTWSDDEINALIKNKDKSIDEICQSLASLTKTGRSPEAVKRKLRRLSIQAPVAEAPQPVTQSDSSHSSVMLDIQKIQRRYEANHVLRETNIDLATSRKILSISDIHFPIANVDMLSRIITAHADADILVLNGDILDNYIFSSFPKHRSVAAIHGYMAAFEFVKTCSEIFPKVYLVEGNHDTRSKKYLDNQNTSKDVSTILKPDLLARIANGEELNENGDVVKKHDFKNVSYDQNEAWYIIVGKTIFLHPWDKPLGNPGLTVRKWGEKLLTRYSRDEVDSFVCGHTHMLYKGIVNGVLYIEQGTVSSFDDYAWSPQKLYSGNGQNGFAVIYQDEQGNTDFNASNMYYLGEILPSKKRNQ